MSPTVPQNGAHAPQTERSLDSWKEIASYLGRAVRTVQTWERQEGLPVHRHQHRKGGTVYAYASEIDAWREGRDDLNSAENGAAGRLGWPGRRLPLAVAGIVALAVAIALSWWLVDETVWFGKRLPDFEERDWLLIADFDNRTGETSFDGTLEAALRRELVNSAFVNVAPRARVEDTLRLMGAPIDTRVDAELAREVALRDGGIQAVLAGRVEKVGPTYLLSIDLHDPADGTIVECLSEEAHGQAEILPAVSSLSVRVRETLGEALPKIPSSTKDLERVSTPSLRALQLYSRANQLLEEENRGGPDRNQAAEELLREAIVEDPGFASAHTHLAWALLRQGRPPEEYLPVAEQAVELADQATVAERYFIRGSYHSMLSVHTQNEAEQEAALAQYQALLLLDPGHFWASMNLSNILWGLGRQRELRDHLLRLVEAKPNDPRNPEILSELAFELGAIEGNLEAARSYVQRARQLQKDLAIEMSPWWAAFLEFFPVHELWLRGDTERVVREVDKIVASLDGRTPAARADFMWYAQHYYLDLGMFGKAEAIQARYPVSNPERWKMLLASRRGDRETLREWIRGLDSVGPLRVSLDDALVLAQLGFVTEAELLLEELPEGGPLSKGIVLAARGTIDSARQRYEDAIPKLEEGIALLRDRAALADYFRTVRILSRAWEALGQPEQGVKVLEEASREKRRLLWAKVYWMEAQLRLAELYRTLGRETEALEVEAELRRYCASADPDFGILRELEKRQRPALGTSETP